LKHTELEGVELVGDGGDGDVAPGVFRHEAFLLRTESGRSKARAAAAVQAHLVFSNLVLHRDEKKLLISLQGGHVNTAAGARAIANERRRRTA
jgi:hypothetical protein